MVTQMDQGDVTGHRLGPNPSSGKMNVRWNSGNSQVGAGERRRSSIRGNIKVNGIGAMPPPGQKMKKRLPPCAAHSRPHRDSQSNRRRDQFGSINQASSSSA